MVLASVAAADARAVELARDGATKASLEDEFRRERTKQWILKRLEPHLKRARALTPERSTLETYVPNIEARAKNGTRR